MTIGIPKALLYYRYGCLWESFFNGLGCTVISSGDTRRDILRDGEKCSADESCLPLKIYLGHIKSLVGRCDYILVPSFKSCVKGGEFCARFFGLYDLVRNIFNGVRLISYNLDMNSGKTESSGFMKIGMTLGFDPVRTYLAYRHAKKIQHAFDEACIKREEGLITAPGIKVLIAAQPYVARDSFMGSTLADRLKTAGAVAVRSDCLDRTACSHAAGEISPRLYFTMNKETAGAAALMRHKVDGVILYSAFPCGPDALVNELIRRRLPDVPVINILVDGQDADAGLKTRIESFMDILHERRKGI